MDLTPIGIANSVTSSNAAAATNAVGTTIKRTTVLEVSGMSCEHCVSRIKKAVSELNGICSVGVDLKAGTVSVVHDPNWPSMDNLRAAIEEQGYGVKMAG